MNHSIVFTFSGADKPGLIEKMSHIVSEHNGNWLESRMSQLAGHFAGIARVQVNGDRATELRTALQAASGDELVITIEADNTAANPANYRNVTLSLIGNDRPGIVRELSGALAKLDVNVCEMNTRITSAPMTAEPLFEASATIQIPVALDINTLSDKLDAIANELSVDINLETDKP